MKRRHDYRNWLAAAGGTAIAFALIGIDGRPWALVAIMTVIGAAVRLKYGIDVRLDAAECDGEA
ncbi:hypothetical protein ACWV27_26295 (plasmid) [Massilia varians]